MKKIISLTVAFVSGILESYHCQPQSEFVASLPDMNGGNNFTFGMYSGYISLPGTSKQIHYLLAESQQNGTDDPLVIWFNGGPGCSSMLGFMQEHGPFIMDSGSPNIRANPYSWNNQSHMLYIE
jgi:carboxypeptidase C (cathepsin A)